MGGEQLAIENCLMLYDTPWIKDSGMATNQDVMLRCPKNICSSQTHKTPGRKTLNFSGWREYSIAW